MILPASFCEKKGVQTRTHLKQWANPKIRVDSIKNRYCFWILLFLICKIQMGAKKSAKVFQIKIYEIKLVAHEEQVVFAEIKSYLWISNMLGLKTTIFISKLILSKDTLKNKYNCWMEYFFLRLELAQVVKFILFAPIPFFFSPFLLVVILLQRFFLSIILNLNNILVFYFHIFF